MISKLKNSVLIANTKYQYHYDVLNEHSVLTKGTWLVLLHASRIPPHIGLMVNGNYNSLTIKERELNVKLEALLKIISQKKIEALFVRIIKHPVFSEEFQLLTFQEQLKLFTKVKENEATCLSPIKLFFEEFYAVKHIKEMLFFDFLEVLNENDFIAEIKGLNVKKINDESLFTFKTYTVNQLQGIIIQETKNQ